jgi:hypothetical protein
MHLCAVQKDHNITIICNVHVCIILSINGPLNGNGTEYFFIDIATCQCGIYFMLGYIYGAYMNILQNLMWHAMEIKTLTGLHSAWD